MKRILSIILVLVLVTGAIIGCSKKADDGNDKVAPVAESEQQETREAVNADQDESTSVWPRAYVDSRGNEIILEKQPERIVVTTWMVTENLLALDMPPAASDTVTMMSEWASMKSYFEIYQIDNLGESHVDVNIEKILDIQPDLILATTANEKIYDQLEKIAPVIVFDTATLFESWQGSIREVAKVVGKEKTAEQFIEKTMDQLKTGREKIATLEAGTFGFLRLINKGIYAFSEEQLSMYYDAAKGLDLSVPRGWPEKTGTISLESFIEIDPDYIFISGSEDQAMMEELEKNAAWNGLKAVKNGHLYPIDLSGLTGGPLATKYGALTIVEAISK